MNKIFSTNPKRKKIMFSELLKKLNYNLSVNNGKCFAKGALVFELPENKVQNVKNYIKNYGTRRIFFSKHRGLLQNNKTHPSQISLDPPIQWGCFHNRRKVRSIIAYVFLRKGQYYLYIKPERYTLIDPRHYMSAFQRYILKRKNHNLRTRRENNQKKNTKGLCLKNNQSCQNYNNQRIGQEFFIPKNFFYNNT